MVGSAESSQLHLLAILNLLCVRVTPLNGHLAVGVGVDEHVEGAVTVELGEEGDGCGDLAEDGGDLGLDLGLSLFGGEGGTASRGCVFLIGRGGLGLGLGFCRLEDLDLEMA